MKINRKPNLNRKFEEVIHGDCFTVEAAGTIFMKTSTTGEAVNIQSGGIESFSSDRSVTMVKVEVHEL